MHLILSFLALSLAYAIYLIYHRLYLSPIAQFPGPKLAAATYWYEFYYDIILGGKYIWKVQEMHKKYGPVIRINPGGLHVADPTFWDVMYTHSTERNRRDKWTWEAWGIGIPASMLGTAPHALHKIRRASINPFFSKQNVRKLEQGIEERVQALVRKLKVCGDGGEVVQMEYAYSAFANDVVMQYCFGRSDHHIEAPDFDPSFHNTSFSAGKAIALLKHLPWLLSIMRALPESVAMKMGDEVSANIKLTRERMGQIEDVRKAGFEKEDEENKTVFHTLLRSDLPEQEKETRRLAEEAVLLVGAGTHTTSWILTVITFYLLSNPPLLQKLRDELRTVLPEVDSHAPLMELEKLPFLTAVLKEGLRLGHGAVLRSSRIAPDASLKCGDWTIPPGTPAAMTIPLTHWDESIFPEAHTFNPHRWLDGNASHLDRYLVAFSKGSRGCVGMNLAWAELYLCAAGVFRRFGSKDSREMGDVGYMELYETDVGDVEMVSDRFFPVAREGSKGVRVRMSN
ncbi:cytochrome P450 [Karstenula rhodostoma CBS 690.94]|uniref:Cytochrome P450 n=1 Tax=Karstenula rhodostoma CBS 690.94 TaxID=1392251 RepID=A0A9P4P4M7_9PLEO|nr:cytochrome P450 [Karstenula rhodostoma CBS 690.94]